MCCFGVRFLMMMLIFLLIKDCMGYIIKLGLSCDWYLVMFELKVFELIVWVIIFGWFEVFKLFKFFMMFGLFFWDIRGWNWGKNDCESFVIWLIWDFEVDVSFCNYVMVDIEIEYFLIYKW